MGKKPTHPELLDFLAGYFIEHGWSIKQMHRVILLSNAYRRASGSKADPLLASFPPRRLEGEELRDSMLALSGEPSPDAGGPGALRASS